MLILLLRKPVGAAAHPVLDPIGGFADESATSTLHPWMPRNYLNIRDECAPANVPDLAKRFEKRYYNTTSSQPMNTTTVTPGPPTGGEPGGGSPPPVLPTVQEPPPQNPSPVCVPQGASMNLPTTASITAPVGETISGGAIPGSSKPAPQIPQTSVIPNSPNIGQIFTSEFATVPTPERPLPFPKIAPIEPSTTGSTLLESFPGLPLAKLPPTQTSSFHVIDTILQPPATSLSLSAEVSVLKSAGDTSKGPQHTLSDLTSLLVPLFHTATNTLSTQSKEEPRTTIANARSSLSSFNHSMSITTIVSMQSTTPSTSRGLITSTAVNRAVYSTFCGPLLLLWIGIMGWVLGGGV